MENAAATILQRAVEMDKNEQYTMALVLYQEGLQILVDSIKEFVRFVEKAAQEAFIISLLIPNRHEAVAHLGFWGLETLRGLYQETSDQVKKKHFQARASQYIDRAERIKSLIDERKSHGKYREQMKIESGSSGHGYGSVFGRFLDANVTQIRVEDPYIRTFHQCQNFVRFCELAVQKCPSLSKVTLITTKDSDPNNQISKLTVLGKSLSNRSISLEITYSETLHDRRIVSKLVAVCYRVLNDVAKKRSVVALVPSHFGIKGNKIAYNWRNGPPTMLWLSNGWIIKIGRGLDYFKPPEGKFVLGAFDLELRPCLETMVDIYHQSHLENPLN